MPDPRLVPGARVEVTEPASESDTPGTWTGIVRGLKSFGEYAAIDLDDGAERTVPARWCRVATLNVRGMGER